MSVSVRFFESKDLADVIRIFSAGIVEEADSPQRLKLQQEYVQYSLSADLADIPVNYPPPRSGFFVATVGDKVVGCVAVQPIFIADPRYASKLQETPTESQRFSRDQYCELRRMSVSSDCRRMGVASKLFSHLLEFARQAGYKVLRLTTIGLHHPANEFYLKNGFKLTDQWPYTEMHTTFNEYIREI